MKALGWGLLLLATGCPKHHNTAMANLQTVAPAPRAVEWREQVTINDAVMLSIKVWQTWEGPRFEDGREVYTVVEKQDDGRGVQVRQQFDVFYGPEGYGYLGTRPEGGPLDPYKPPEVVLPLEPVVGATWSSVHRKGVTDSDRSCELIESDLCKGGMVSVCDTVRPDTRVVTRDHFCPVIGWAGYESLFVREGQRERRWTEALTKDGIDFGPR